MREGVVVCVCIAVAFAMSDEVRAPLTNDDVVRLVKAGFGETLVLQAIDINPHKFDLSRDALANLRKAGVAEAVIAAMSAKRPGTAEHLPLLDPAVYVKRGDVYALVDGEPIAWRVAASDASAGDLIHITLAGYVANLMSHLSLTGPAELLIVTPPGTSASEYLVLRGAEKDDTREFRAEGAVRNGALLGLSGKPFVSAPTDATFDLGVRVLLGSLPRGEYGVVPPGVVSGGRVISHGTIYTFRIE
jgi:hypothetical protein